MLSKLGISMMAICLSVSAIGTVVAQPPNLFNPLQGAGPSSSRPEDLLRLSGEYRVFAGSREGLISLKATLEAAWHVYSTTQKAGGPQISRIRVEKSKDFELTRPFVADRPPLVRPPEPGIFPVPSEEFSSEVIWNAPIRISDSANPQQLSVTVIFDGQVCQDEGSCVPISNLAVAVKYAGELAAVKKGEFSNPQIHAKIRGQIAPRTVTPGGTVKLTLTAEPAKNFHVYALADKDPEKEGSKPALIAWKQKYDWQVSRPEPSAKPTEHPGTSAGEVVHYYEDAVTWTIQIRVPEDATPAGYELSGLLGYQTCTNASCDRPGGAEFSAIVAVVKPGEPVDGSTESLTFKPANYLAVAKLAAASATSRVSEVPSGVQPALQPDLPRATQAPRNSNLAGTNYDGPLLEVTKLQPVGAVVETKSMFAVLPTAFLAGFILNFMPCVLPVIGLKIVSFVHQAGESRSRVFFLNLWYSLGMLAVFLVLASLAVFAGFGWGKQFQSPAFNIVLASVVFAFALSFLGVWEIALPGFVGTSAANQVADKEGPAGAFFKGVLTTILATPCSGPMLVPALAWALKQPPAMTYTAFICVGLGMSMPYLILGAFPRLVSFLPKPGAWMETFKQLMGFVLIGSVVYLLTFIRMPLVVPTVAFMMGLWAALWWIGRVPVWEELNKRLRAWAFGIAFAAFIGIVAFSWLSSEMESRFKRDVIAAFGKPEFDPTRIESMAGSGEASSHLRWKPYSLPLLSKLLLVEKKPVFVDFTADWCPNCKVNEKIALNVASTKSFVEANGIETIKADKTYDSPEIDELLEKLSGATAIPVYAVFSPDDPYHPLVIEGLLTQSRVLGALAQGSKARPAATTAELVNDSSRRVE